MFFRISAALNSPLGLCLGAQTVHRRAEIVSLSADLGIPEMLKLHWLNRLFARKSVSGIL
jgi:hypothetical protein